MPHRSQWLDANIRVLAQEKLGKRACQFQLLIAQHLWNKKDVVAVAPTGSGKTMSFWMPLLFRPSGTVVVITPLNILGGQNKDSLARLGIKTISIDAQTATPSNLQVRRSSNLAVLFKT